MIMSNKRLSGTSLAWLAGILLLAGAAAAPVHGDTFEYYVWKDDDNVVHMEDRPPEGRDYETRVVDTDKNVMAGTEIRPRDESFESSGSDSFSARRAPTASAGSTAVIPRESTSGVGRAVLLEESAREQAGVDIGPRSILPPNGASPTDSTLPRSILPEARGSRSIIDRAPFGSTPPSGASPTERASPASILPGSFR